MIVGVGGEIMVVGQALHAHFHTGCLGSPLAAFAYEARAPMRPRARYHYPACCACYAYARPNPYWCLNKNIPLEEKTCWKIRFQNTEQVRGWRALSADILHGQCTQKRSVVLHRHRQHGREGPERQRVTSYFPQGEPHLAI